MQLEPADILLVRGRSWLSRAIRKFERGPHEAKSWASHCALSVGDGSIVEALSQGVVVHEMPYARGPRLQVWRPISLSDAEKKQIVRHALSYRGLRYGWFKVALHALGLQRFAFHEGTPICSWVVAVPFSKAGLTFGVPANSAEPDDIMDFMLRHPDRYRRVA